MAGQRGQPTKLDDVTHRRIVDAIREGNDQVVAAAAAGIGERTFYDWMTWGRAGKERYSQFSQAVEKAKAEAELRKVKIVGAAAEDSWQAASWWLERKHPERWGRRDRSPVSEEELRRESERAAEEYNVPVEEVLAQAQRLLAGAKK